MKKLIQSLFIILLVLVIFPSHVSADMGPKPSIRITFKNIDEEFYVTLLSKEDGYGPYEVYEESDENTVFNNSKEKAYHEFYEYCKNDDYYFLGVVDDCTETKEYSWTYYPPEDFKLAIYLVQSDKLIVTDAYSKYAFDSYYEYDLNTNSLKENYNHTFNILSLIIRVIITVIIEVLIALLFKFKAHLKLIVIVNIITQLLLNLFVYFCEYSGGLLTAAILVFLGEGLVLIVESIIFKIIIKKRAIIYAFVANIASFAIGSIIYLLLYSLG